MRIVHESVSQSNDLLVILLVQDCVCVEQVELNDRINIMNNILDMCFFAFLCVVNSVSIDTDVYDMLTCRYHNNIFVCMCAWHIRLLGFRVHTGSLIYSSLCRLNDPLTSGALEHHV